MYSVGTYWKYARFQTHYKTYQANSKINLLEILMGNWNIGTYAWSTTIHAVVAVTAATEYFDTCAWCMSVYESVCHWICNTKFQNITCARKLSHQTTSHHTDVKYLAMIMNNNSFCPHRKTSCCTQIKLSLKFNPGNTTFYQFSPNAFYRRAN